jgi:serine phosphatase RsbU (regulator of sigma subunit)
MKSLLFFSFFIFCHFISHSQENVLLENKGIIQPIGKNVYFFTDTLGVYSIQDMLKAEMQSKFATSVLEIPNFGNTTSTIWGKVSFKMNSSDTWYLEIGNPLIDSLRFYYPDNQGIYQEKTVGATIIHSLRDVQTNLFLFELFQATDTVSVKTFYFSIKSNFPMLVPINVGTIKPFLEENHGIDIAIGIYLGFMLVMILYNFFIYLSVRDITYLFYVGYAFFIMILYSNFKGYAFEFLWADKSIINFYVPTISNFAASFIILFSQRFLNTKLHLPKWHKAGYVIITIFIISTIINLLGNYPLSANLSQPFTLIMALYLLIIAIRLVFKRIKVARFYLLAWTIYLICLIIYILNLNSVVPTNLFTNNSILYGSALEAVLLSIALADRINILKKENEKAQLEYVELLKENERIVKEQNLLLEKKVQERTVELNEANEELNQTVETLHSTNEQLNNFNRKLAQQSKELDAKNQELSTALEEINSANEALMSSYEDVKVLSQIGQEISQTLRIDNIIRALYDNINKIMDAEAFAIGIYKETIQQLIFTGYSQKDKMIPHDYYRSIKNENDVAVKTFLSGQPILISDTEEEIQELIHSRQEQNLPKSLIYIPIKTELKAIGVITVQSYQKNAYDQHHINLLQNLASYCAFAIQNANSYHLIETKNQNITKSIEYAYTIQNAILPSKDTLQKVFTDHFVLYRPKDIVSGDFYWHTRVEYYDFFAVADCTGHGVPGAFMSVIGNNLLKEAIIQKRIIQPEKVLDYIHKEIRIALSTGEGKTGDGMDLALCRFEKSGMETKLIFSGAKRPLWIIREGGEFIELKGTRIILGGIFDKEFHAQELLINQKDSIYMFTDGLADQPNTAREKFNIFHFKNALQNIHSLPMFQQIELLEKELDIFSENTEQRDDISVVGLRV